MKYLIWGAAILSLAIAVPVMAQSHGIVQQDHARTFTPSTAPDDYMILNNISIFSRNRTQRDAIAGDGTGGSSGSPALVRRPAPVFVGVMKVDTGYVAFITTQLPDGTMRMKTLHVGDRIDWDGSIVTGVTLEKLFLRGGAHNEILAGNTLQNEPAQPSFAAANPMRSLDTLGGGNPVRTTNLPTASGPGRFGRNSRTFGLPPARVGTSAYAPAIPPVPTAMSSDPPLPAGSADDLIARMKQRRLEQIRGN